MGVTRGCSSPEPGGHSSLRKSRPVPGRGGSPPCSRKEPSPSGQSWVIPMAWGRLLSHGLGRGRPIPGKTGCPPWSGERPPHSGQGWVPPQPEASSPQSGEKPPHSGQGWVPPWSRESLPGSGQGWMPPMVWGEATRSGQGWVPHVLGPAPQLPTCCVCPVPWRRRPCRGVPADASSLVSPDGLSEVRNLPKQKAELFSNRFENYEKNMKTPIEE